MSSSATTSELTPENEWVTRGLHLLKQGDPRAAIACFDLALDAEPRGPCAVLAWWQKALSLEACSPEVYSTTPEWMLWWQVQCYEEVLRLSADEHAARFNLARAYRGLNNYAKAADSLQQITDAGQAGAFEPHFSASAVYDLLAKDYMQGGDYQRGLSAVQQAMKAGIHSDALRGHQVWFEQVLSPDSEKEAWSRPFTFDATGGPLSRVSIELTELKNLGLRQSIDALLEDVRLTHGTTAVAESAQRMEQLWGDLSMPETVPTEMALQDRIDTTADVVCTFAGTLIEQRDYAEAWDVLNRVALEFPAEASVHSTRGLWYAAQQQHEAAADCYARAVAADPTDAFTWCQQVNCLARLDRIAEAREACRRGMQSVPEKDRGLFLLQAALEAADNPSKALGLLFRLEKWAPGDDIRLVRLRCLLLVGRLDEARRLVALLKTRLKDGDAAAQLGSLEEWLERLSRHEEDSRGA